MSILSSIPVFLAQAAAPAPSAPAQATPASVRLGVGLHRQGSTFGPDYDLLFWAIFWLCTFFFVLLMGLAIGFVFKYRRVPGVPQQRSASHNTPLELTWSVGPLVILFVVFFWGFDKYMDMHVAPANCEQISVIAKKWAWTWKYDNGALGGSGKGFRARVADMDVPVFAIPAGRPVRLQMISEDVMHSSYVPDFRTKIDLYPSRYTTMWFEAPAEAAGQEHYLFCAEFCGEQHSQMAAVVRVLDEQAYAEYKSDNAVKLEDLPPHEAGKVLYLTRACNTCHSVDGKVSTGPSWLDIYGKTEEFVSGGSTIVDANYIRESILDPSKNIVKGFSNQMTSFQGLLTEAEIGYLVAYIKSLSEKGRAELEAAKANGAAGGEGAAGDQKPQAEEKKSEGAPAPH